MGWLVLELMSRPAPCVALGRSFGALLFFLPPPARTQLSLRTLRGAGRSWVRAGGAQRKGTPKNLPWATQDVHFPRQARVWHQGEGRGSSASFPDIAGRVLHFPDTAASGSSSAVARLPPFWLSLLIPLALCRQRSALAAALCALLEIFKIFFKQVVARSADVRCGPPRRPPRNPSF